MIYIYIYIYGYGLCLIQTDNTYMYAFLSIKSNLILIRMYFYFEIFFLNIIFKRACYIVYPATGLTIQAPRSHHAKKVRQK